MPLCKSPMATLDGGVVGAEATYRRASSLSHFQNHGAIGQVNDENWLFSEGKNDHPICMAAG